MKRVLMTKSLVALLFTAAPLVAQLTAGDFLLLSSNALTHISGGSGTPTPVVPVPADGVAFPSSWLDGACEWVRNTQYVLVGQDTSPFGLFLLDFTNSIASPTSRRLGTGIGGIRDIDFVDASGAVLVLQNVVQGMGQIDIINGPIGPTSVLGSNPPWAVSLPINQADYLAVQDPMNVVVGGVANIYRVQQGLGASAAALAFGGTTPYSIESVDIDQATGDLYIAQFNPDLVTRYIGGVGLTYSSLGTVLTGSEVDGPDDVEFDFTTATVWAVGRNGGTFSATPWSVQAGFDNAIIGNMVTAPPGLGYTAAGTPSGHGNSGLFANIAVVGNIILNPAGVITTGTGCTGTSGSAFAWTPTGLPTLGNPSFGLTASGGPAFAPNFIFLALSASPVPIAISPLCNLYLDVPSLQAFLALGSSPIGPIPLDPFGSMALVFSIPNDPMLIGTTLASQCAAADAVPGGVVTSNALTMVFGN